MRDKNENKIKRIRWSGVSWLWKILQKILVVFVHEKSNHNGDAFLMFANAVDNQHGTVIFECGLNEFHRFVAIRQHRGQIRRFTEI